MISLRVDPGIFSFSLSTLSTSDVEVPHHVRRRVLHNGYPYRGTLSSPKWVMTPTRRLEQLSILAVSIPTCARDPAEV